MNILKYINIPVFIVSMALGIMAVYISAPKTRQIFVYPTHENSGLIQYRDKTNTCFSIEERTVRCPSNTSKISKIPIQM